MEDNTKDSNKNPCPSSCGCPPQNHSPLYCPPYCPHLILLQWAPLPLSWQECPLQVVTGPLMLEPRGGGLPSTPLQLVVPSTPLQQGTLTTVKTKSANVAGTMWRASNAVSMESTLAAFVAGSVISAEHQHHPPSQK